jgi:hypothetical protein
MGLDSIWKMPEYEQFKMHHPVFDPPLKLCGGILSCNGKYSFRGKVYSEIISKVWGCGLYLEEISNSDIREIATALESAKYKDLKEFYPYEGFGESEFNDLVRMFRVYADAGASLIGWW